MVKKIHPETGGWFLEASSVMTNFRAKAMNSIAKATNSIAKWMNSIAKVTNSFANRTNSIAKATNSIANGTNSIAKATNSIAKTYNKTTQKQLKKQFKPLMIKALPSSHSPEVLVKYMRHKINYSVPALKVYSA